MVVSPELEAMAVKELGDIGNESEALIREKYEAREYTDPKQLNEMYQLLHDFYESKLDEYLMRVPLLKLIAFLLTQYEDYFKEYHEKKKLLEELPPRAFSDPPSVQKGLLYAMEKALILDNEEESEDSEERMAINMRAIELCATRVMDWAVCSDQIHGIYKDDTTVEILPPGGEEFFTSRITPELRQKMAEIDTCVDEEYHVRKKILTGMDLPMELGTRRKVLDPVLKKELGVTFDEKRSILNSFVQSPFDHIHIIKADIVIEHIQQKTGFDRDIIVRVIEGLLITKEKLNGDTPSWLINAQPNRITRRPIMGFELPDGYHYAWGVGMTRDVLNYFNGLIIFNGLPSEWMSPPVKQAVEDLSLEVSTWLEYEFGILMNNRGFVGRKVNDFLGSDKFSITFPHGEVDYLGFNSDKNLLIVSECKLVKWSSEPRHCYDDYKKFVDNGKEDEETFVETLTKKYQWVCENVADVIKALEQEFPGISCSRPVRVACALVTYHPMRVSLLIKEMPCRSIVKFIADFDEKGDWPYEEGIREI